MVKTQTLPQRSSMRYLVLEFNSDQFPTCIGPSIEDEYARGFIHYATPLSRELSAGQLHVHYDPPAKSDVAGFSYDDQERLTPIWKQVSSQCLAAPIPFDSLHYELPSGMHLRFAFIPEGHCKEKSLDNITKIPPRWVDGDVVDSAIVTRKHSNEGTGMSLEEFKSSLPNKRDHAPSVTKFIRKQLVPGEGESSIAATICYNEQGLQIFDTDSLFKDKLQCFLTWLEGQSFGSFENNKRVANALQNHLTKLGFLFICPKCNRTAYLRCQPAGNAKHGLFRFGHVQEGRQAYHASSARFPKRSRLVFAPRIESGLLVGQ